MVVCSDTVAVVSPVGYAHGHAQQYKLIDPRTVLSLQSGPPKLSAGDVFLELSVLYVSKVQQLSRWLHICHLRTNISP